MIFLYPTAIFPDSSWGFQVLQKMQAGGDFNLAVKPSQSDISKSYTEFLTWWSPGQYLVPYAFIVIFGVDIGQASAITITLFTLLGLAGFYSFFKKAGFTPVIATISVVVIACQQAFIIPFVFYNGGEVLLFGTIGWFLYGCVAINNADWRLAIFLLLWGWAGFFCKSSFLWMYAAGCLYLWIKLSSGQTTIVNWVKKGLWIGIPAIISLAVIYISYLSKGVNPASGSTGLKLTWETFSFPLASPILSGFSIDDLMGGLLYHYDAGMLNAFWSLIAVLLAAVLSILIITRIAQRVPEKRYTLLVTVFYCVSVVFFFYNFLRQVNISYEARHMRVIGLLIIPGIVYLVSKSNLTLKAAFAMICFIIAFFSIRYFVPSYKQNMADNARGTTGLAQIFADQASLNYLMDLDRKNTNALFVFISPDLGLEIKHNRIVTLDPIDDDISIDYDDYVHRGHAGPIFIFLPASYMGPKSNIVRKCFPGYKGFRMEMLSNDYVLYSAK